MIKATIQNSPYCTEIRFPCSETELSKKLGEIGMNTEHLAPVGMVIEVEPTELSILQDCDVSLDALNYLGKRLDGMDALERKQFLAALNCPEISEGWQMAGIFADEGISGTQAKKRPEFLKMIRLCRQRKIDIILTKSLSRFARNTVDSLKYIRELRELGIAVISEKENINTLTAESEMLITIMSCFAQAESESISKNVSWGVRQSFKNGNVPIKYTTLLGYKKGADGLPEIVPEEAEI